jgi:23S rRNA (pseudouridine1915-N3)-methyltransferase
MKIALVTVGKTQTKDLQDSVLDYTHRISRYSAFEFIETTDEKLAKTLDKFDRVFLLDEKGREYTSMEMSEFINKQMSAGLQNIAFVVGGPFGFSAEIRNHPRVLASGANSTIALSKLTFPHDLVRVIFLEQLYRAFTILKNEKYHHQ